MTHTHTITLTQKIFRPLLALSLAASIALSPVSATPAQAGNDDTAKIIGALIALGLIGAVITNNNHQPQTQQPTTQTPRKARIPASCLQSYETRQGMKTLLARGCLAENYRQINTLPRNCALQVRFRNSRGRWVTHNAFRPNCLTNQGYKITYGR